MLLSLSLMLFFSLLMLFRCFDDMRMTRSGAELMRACRYDSHVTMLSHAMIMSTRHAFTLIILPRYFAIYFFAETMLPHDNMPMIIHHYDDAFRCRFDISRAAA